MNTTTTEHETIIDLHDCTGSEQVFRGLGLVYTEGVRALAQGAECYWLIDAIGSYQPMGRVRRIPFQVWTLQQKNDGALLSLWNDKEHILTQEIEYTDFPFARIRSACASWTDTKISLWLIDGVLLLPSEY